MIPNATSTVLSAFPLQRPALMVEAANFCAARYERERDLPGAVPGLLGRRTDTILSRLLAAEHQCEEERRARSAAYRPARHLQILAALLAEAGALHAQPENSEGAAFMAAPNARKSRMKTRRPASRKRPADRDVSPLQAKASGSDAFRVAM